MADYSKGLWMAATVYGMMVDNPETIILKSTHKKSPKLFIVNKAVLRHYSTYFEQIFSDSWKEGREGKAEFEVEQPQRVLRLLHGFLSTGCIYTDFDPDTILKLYKYGDYIGCVALRRAVILHLQKVSKTSDGSINIISYQTMHDNEIWTKYSHTGLYRFIVDTFAFHWHYEMDNSPAEANFDIPGSIPVKFAYDQLVTRTKYQHAIGNGIGVGDFRCWSGLYGEEAVDGHENQDVDAEMEDKIEEVDFNAIKNQCIDIVNELLETGNDTEMSGGNQEFEGNGTVHASTITIDTTEGMDSDVNGKRKAQDDGEEEDVSAKKHKQED
ncbi:hypothetical protein KCU95_g5004, partial [Aureobasidium melanogenum]